MFEMLSSDILATTLHWLPFAQRMGVSRVCASFQTQILQGMLLSTFPFLSLELNDVSMSELQSLLEKQKFIYRCLANQQNLNPITLLPKNLTPLLLHSHLLSDFTPFQQLFLHRFAAASDLIESPLGDSQKDVFLLAACIGNKIKLAQLAPHVSADSQGTAFVTAAKYGQLPCLIYLYQHYRKKVRKIYLKETVSETIKSNQLPSFKFLEAQNPETSTKQATESISILIFFFPHCQLVLSMLSCHFISLGKKKAAMNFDNVAKEKALNVLKKRLMRL